jgi:hypothetical protein
MTDWSRRPFVSLAAGAPALLLGVNESRNQTTGASPAEAFHRAAA